MQVFSQPKISIITVTYNSEKTVRDTLESIKRQSYDNLEYIIIDGKSTDNTLNILNEYKDIITILISEPDNGISDAMNKGIRLATGDIIGIIHSDDMINDGAFEVLQDNYSPNVDVIYGDCIVCNEAGEKMHVLHAKRDLSDMNYNFGLIHPSSFVTRNAYERYGVYGEKYHFAMDYELFLRFYKCNAVFKYINKPLAIYRLGGTNQKNRKKTIKEVRDISILHGANPVVAEFIREKKMIKDFLRPYIKRKNKRVEPLR